MKKLKYYTKVFIIAFVFFTIACAGAYSQEPAVKNNIKKEPQAQNNISRWDEIAKTVRFTVSQEKQLKKILETERAEIMEARSKTADRIMDILDSKQKEKWDSLYTRADNISGRNGRMYKRMLLNPEYLRANFSLKPAQYSKTVKIAAEHAKQVGKIRLKQRAKIEKILQKDQMEKWDRALNMCPEFGL